MMQAASTDKISYMDSRKIYEKDGSSDKNDEIIKNP